jgi:hypothetical protein
MVCNFGNIGQFIDPGKVGFLYRDELKRYW